MGLTPLEFNQDLVVRINRVLRYRAELFASITCLAVFTVLRLVTDTRQWRQTGSGGYRATAYVYTAVK